MNSSKQLTQAENLQNWLIFRSKLNVKLPSFLGPSSVSVVAYHFWDDKLFDRQLDLLTSAVRETWHQCGLLKTVLVVNRLTRKLEDFAAASSGLVRLDLCPDLTPGNLYSMSVDCILRLHARVDTEHILIVQNDGFPVRPNLDAFLWKYDYIGAPWRFNKDDKLTRFFLRHRNDVGNGGFSLRSKHLCEMTSWYYQRKYKFIPQCYLITEDFFICRTLPSLEKRFRETVRIAPAETAATFSLEENIDLYRAVQTPPFGFHGPSAFAHLQSEGLIPNEESTAKINNGNAND